MARVQIPRLTCQKCGHRWRPRREIVNRCPHCFSPYWDRKYREDGSLRSEPRSPRGEIAP